MDTSTIPHPAIVSRDEWLAQRKQLLIEEKELTRQSDRVNAARRRLPMVKVEKEYVFEGSQGAQSLPDLFEDRRQLIIYHFMFDPEWDKGCQGCTSFVNSMGDISLINQRDTTFAIVSRAPLGKLERYREEMGWTQRWYSSFGSDFNYDFHVTSDASKAPVEYNYRTASEAHVPDGEEHGLSVFFRLDDTIYHTYSTYARGTEMLTNAYSLLDVTPYGRQQDFESSPAGWPQRKTYG